MIGREDLKTIGLGVCVGTVLIGVFGAGAFVASKDEAPPIGRVRLDELAVQYVAGAVGEQTDAAAAATATRAWAVRLEAALDRVAEERGVVLLPAQAVAAGAPDYTEEVRWRLENAPQEVLP